MPVREGTAPAGADEAVAEAGGHGLLIGERTREAVPSLGSARRLLLLEMGSFAPSAWAATLAPLLPGEDLVLLPASPDGRDLAPRLAAAMRRPLLAGAILATPERIVVVRHAGLVAEEHHLGGPAVATLVPGCRGVESLPAGAAPPELTDISPAPPSPVPAAPAAAAAHDAEVLEVLPPDPATMDLAEAGRIVAGGAGLGSAASFELLASVAAALGASAGATRVATDAGWMSGERQIGTTGVAVAPRLYVAIGISGAVQHVSGLGQPDHVVSVNLDPSCPMMALADLAIVTDGPALLAELAARLGTGAGPGARGPGTGAGAGSGARGAGR
ncbi:MAG: mycofactocin-associated electron transfer flavoprotein alpha subunit [Acidimicrobiales bacterium]